jgi:hypothetical protein
MTPGEEADALAAMKSAEGAFDAARDRFDAAERALDAAREERAPRPGGTGMRPGKRLSGPPRPRTGWRGGARGARAPGPRTVKWCQGPQPGLGQRRVSDGRA